MIVTMTTDQQDRTAKMFADMAGEPVTVELVNGAVYGFSSELGCLRIFAKYNSNGSVHNPNVRVGYSDNLQSWYVSLN